MTQAKYRIVPYGHPGYHTLEVREHVMLGIHRWKSVDGSSRIEELEGKMRHLEGPIRYYDAVGNKL